MSLADYLRYPHLLTSSSGDLTGLVDDALAWQGLSRRVVLSSSCFTPLRHDKDPGHAWFHGLVADVIAGLAMERAKR